MSVLQEILEKGYVDPEVLKQLGEEQKQILFIKMREEQLRKWRLREADLEKMEEKGAEAMMGEQRRGRRQNVKNGGTRRVQWLNGRNGEVWVWVMGEHADDKSIEQILEMESKEKARRLAEKEIMQTLRKAEDLPNALERGREEEEENMLKAELARVELNGGSGGGGGGEEKQPNSHSPYDELLSDGANGGAGTSLDELGPILHFGKAFGNYKETTAKTSPFAHNDPQEIYDNLTNLPPPPQNHSATPPPPFLRQFPGKARHENGTNGNNSVERPKPPPVPEKPASLRRTVSNNLNNGLAGIDQIAFNTIRSYIPPEEVQKRQSKIFEQLKEDRERLEREADMEARRQEAEYEERERKAREADETIRRTVQRAREQHRKNLRTSDTLLPLFRDNPNGASVESVRDALRALPRPPKPKSRQTIIQWFQETEIGQWRGEMAPPKWFHGIISREEAERLLHAKPLGSFLVRVTERIFGYTVSYRAEEGIKNFLVERIADGYQFMGTNQLVHPTLADLIGHHQVEPITAKGGEILREPIGQQQERQQMAADYDELFRRPERRN